MQILLIDDDLNLCKVISHQLQKNGHEVVLANSGNEGLICFQNSNFDLIITDIQMPDITGIEVLKKIRQIDKQVIVIIITAYGSVENAIEACRLGANDYITKPFGQEQLFFVLEKAVRLRELQRENVQLRRELAGKFQFKEMIAFSPKMTKLFKITRQVADSDATVLIYGESGTGKELIARAIHYNSPRNRQPIITVNCPSIPENLLESELFGHVKGAFTGALKDRKGKFELADKGSIFLDEIGDLKADLQAKLLRVLQEQELERVGDSKIIKINVRVIAATNKKLLDLVAEKVFREDLYYRLSVVPLNIPPLRERLEDIPYLTDFFIKRYGKGKVFEVSPLVYEKFNNYDWPGNVRELENVIYRLIVLSEQDTITPEDLPANILAGSDKSKGSKAAQFNDELTFEQVERNTLRKALERCSGNQSKAARILEIPRHVLLYKMQKLGMK